MQRQSRSAHGPGLTFPRRCRLKNPRTVRAIGDSPDGRRRVAAFRALWSEGEPSAAAPAQFAFVASRHCGAAHVRNRIKRRLREAVRANKVSWPIGFRIVIKANGNRAAYESFEHLCAQMKTTLELVRNDSDVESD